MPSSPPRSAAPLVPPAPPVKTAAQQRWHSAYKLATNLTKGVTTIGEKPPLLSTPNAVFQLQNKQGTHLQNTIYNKDGLPIAQVDFKKHGAAPPGHSHRTTTPGDIASAHSGSGGSDIHYAPEATPKPWAKRIPGAK